MVNNLNKSNKIISVTNLYLNFGKKEILKNISFDIWAGEYISIIGGNGSGKSTLIKTLCRINNNYSGEIAVWNRPLEEYKQAELARKISYVAQFNSIPGYSVFEFVMMSRYSYFSPFSSVSKEDLDCVNNSLNITNISELATRKMFTLSGGERQRVIIASAIAQNSSIILLDEPTTYLDPKYQDEIHEIIYKINKEQSTPITIVNVTHDINAAIKFSDRILALKNGCLIFKDTPAELLTSNTLKTIYDKDFLVMDHPTKNHKIVVGDI